MAAYFFDSSALVKRFAQEQGSAFVLSLLRPSTKNRLYAARITEVEVCAALARRKKANTINATQAAKGLRRLRHDLPRRFTQVAMGEGVLVEASRLAEVFALRGYVRCPVSGCYGGEQGKSFEWPFVFDYGFVRCGTERRGAN